MVRHARLAIALLVVVPTAVAGSGPAVRFAQDRPIRIGSHPESLAVGDVDGNGRPDILVTTSNYFDPRNDYKLFVFHQRRAGGLKAPVRLDPGSRTSGAGLAVGDLTGDRKADVAVATLSGVAVFTQGRGELTGPRLLPVPLRGATELEIADMNGDGKSDIVVTRKGGYPGSVDELSVLVNTGRGFKHRVVAPASLTELELGDVNGDRRPDILAVAWGGGAKVYVWRQTPSGGYAQERIETGPSASLDSVTGLEVADVTGDARADVVVTCGGNSSACLRVLVQQTDGTLAAPIRYPSYDIPSAVEASDMNGDRRLDVVVLHDAWKRAGVYLQRRDGSLGAETLYPVPYSSYNPNGLGLVDVNRDGRRDIAIAGAPSGLVVLKQRP